MLASSLSFAIPEPGFAISSSSNIFSLRLLLIKGFPFFVDKFAIAALSSSCVVGYISVSAIIVGLNLALSVSLIVPSVRTALIASFAIIASSRVKLSFFLFSDSYAFSAFSINGFFFDTCGAFSEIAFSTSATNFVALSTCVSPFNNSLCLFAAANQACAAARGTSGLSPVLRNAVSAAAAASASCCNSEWAAALASASTLALASALAFASASALALAAAASALAASLAFLASSSNAAFSLARWSDISFSFAAIAAFNVATSAGFA